MTKKEILNFLNENPVFFLSTIENNQPKERGMLLYKADEKGIIFHTAASKEVYKQIMANPESQLCFYNYQNNTQIRISGKLETIQNQQLKESITEDPNRGFF